MSAIIGILVPRMKDKNTSLSFRIFKELETEQVKNWPKDARDRWEDTVVQVRNSKQQRENILLMVSTIIALTAGIYLWRVSPQCNNSAQQAAPRNR
jgi:hypothetical protein